MGLEKDGEPHHPFQFAGRDVQPFWRAIENQLDLVLAESAVEQRLRNLLGLVERRHFEGGHQTGLVAFLERRHADRAQSRPRSTSVQSNAV